MDALETFMKIVEYHLSELLQQFNKEVHDSACKRDINLVYEGFSNGEMWSYQSK